MEQEIVEEVLLKTQLDNTPEEDQLDLDIGGHQIVTCSNCGSKCVWIEDANGWILCDANSLDKEDGLYSIHYCETAPNFIDVSDEAEAEAEAGGD